MTIEKGREWGSRSPLPGDAVIVHDDASARRLVERARAIGMVAPTLGLLGGDLWRTLGAPAGGEARLRSNDAYCFPIDLGLATIDGKDHCFVAHLVARSRGWRHAVVVMNAPWLGDLNLGPRAHPNDGLLDIYEAELGWPDVLKVRNRARHGTHLPHPRIRQRRVTAAGLDFGRGLEVWLDGEHTARASRMAVRIQPDALTVVV